jgi:aryl-alcohol dehydrogenase-like predicted oxidoreductase
VPTAALQIEYSLLQRAPEHDLLPMAKELGLGIMGYSPLAGGLLTGKYRRGEEGRATVLKGAVAHKDDGHGASVIDAVIAISQEFEITPSQVAIAWTMANGIFTIIGPRTPSQFLDNLRAAALDLSTEAMERLTSASEIDGGPNP